MSFNTSGLKDLHKIYELFGKTFITYPSILTEEYTKSSLLFKTKCNVEICQISFEDFSSIIDDTAGKHISLWESCYRSNQGTLLDSNTLVIQDLYERFYLKADPCFCQICDHISFQALFAGHLWNLVNKVENKYESTLINILLRFLEGHLLFLISKVRLSTYGLYKQWLEFMENEIKEHLSLLNSFANTNYICNTSSPTTNCSSSIAAGMNTCNTASNSTSNTAYAAANIPKAKNDIEGNISEEDFYTYLYEAINNKCNDLPAPYGFVYTEKCFVEEQIFHSSGRNNCGGRCVIQVHEKKGNILNLSPIAKKVANQNDADTAKAKQSNCPGSEESNYPKACVRGYGYRQTNLSPERLRYPLKRVGERGEGRFERISWNEAVNIITNEVKRITDIYGPESRYVIYSTGVSAMIRPNQMAKRLFALTGGYLDSYNSYSSACTDIATPYTYGTGYTGNSSHFFSESKLIILWGHNPSESIFGSELLKELLKAKKKGCKIISIDPRFSDTAAALADQWIGIRPSTDSALTDAMAYVILTEGLEDRSFMDKYCLGFDEEHMPEGVLYGESYESYLFGKKDGVLKTPEWAEAITGVPKDTIISLAREYATCKPAALVQGLGPQRTCNGEQTARSSTLLPCLTGNVGIPGGYAGGNGFIPLKPMPMTRSLSNPYPAVIPTFLWTDAILRGTDMTKEKDMIRGVDRLKAPIKLIFNLAGNTLINQHSDVNKTAEILKDTSLCEFIVVSDLFMTPSAKFADILLPGTSFLESENITYPWREGDFFLYTPKVIEPLFESRFEYDWLKEVAAGLGVYDAFTDGKENVLDWVTEAYENWRKSDKKHPSFEKFCADEGYFYKEPSDFIAFKKQVEDFEHNPFPTPSGKIEIFSKALYDFNNADEIPAIPKYIEGFEGPLDPLTKKYPLQLMGWHTKRRCHSIHDNNSWMEEIEPPKVWINPKDAKERNITEGQLTEVWNDRGIIQIPAHVTNRIVPGVIAISQGAWFTPDNKGRDIRGNINTLTTQRPTPLAKGNPQHTNLAEIKGL